MGQAKRRKELGEYPNQTPKERSRTRIKPPYTGYGFDPIAAYHHGIMLSILANKRRIKDESDNR